ncbi:hypothetical protein A3A79_03265 [Candidatus Gottesmanbacteria bacterium RIFCSPLOWO2_01_FULL_43_11b]|uniref:Diphthamide synthase domain-containing protein n=1 Tax=Candidatus Gottesmanbacteria bacterium RIFCSPLOWO2_01_FULL_43_11b TaxID=1798392 RepID=A0A1F6AHL5_9BACT|nr:MAG: hypothetical protein A3A79_03265 [Candidatus Gottesmanbacteria bacterium RIFCSPLOWO2_01_FULL_43_11b]
MPHKSAIATWSGGKDSCLAAYKAMKAGYTISYLANTVSREYKRVRFHGVEDTLIQKQAKAIGIPLLQQETTAKWYWKEFTANLRKGFRKPIEGVVFGDIHLEECFEWSQKVCTDLSVHLVEPLWQKKPETILEEFINLGFEAIIVSAQANLFGKEWVGKTIDKSFLVDIKKLKGIDVCGENGEYHSLVLNGPMFKQKINILKSKPLYRDGYWFLDIQKYRLNS